MTGSESILRLARSNLACYALLQKPDFVFGSHLEAIIKECEAIARRESTRLIINTPPQHGKTTVLELLISWFLGLYPDKNAVLCCHTQELVDRGGRSIRSYLNSVEHLAVFPECRIRDDSAAAHRFDLTRGGGFYGVGIGGGLTGRRADLLVIDDPHKDAAEVRSETIRRGILEWFRRVALTRQSPDAAIIVTMTRWHHDDLAGTLLREEADEWRHLCFPAINDKGEALWPERGYDLNWVERQKSRVGLDAFWAMYQQSPTNLESQIFNPEYWKHFDVMPTTGTTVIAVDPAAGVGRDRAAFAVLRGNEEGIFLIDLMASNKWQFHEQCAVLHSLYERYRPQSILIEETGTGFSLASEFRREKWLPIQGVKPEGKDKTLRAQLIQHLLVNGLVYLPRQAPWLEGFLDEANQFPAGRYDDQVDALIYGLEWLRDKRSQGLASGCASVLTTCGTPIANGRDLARASGGGGLGGNAGGITGGLMRMPL